MNKPICLLLIHGFGGSEREVLPLAEALRGQGLCCHVARLAGHGGGRGTIDNIPWRRWVDSVRADYLELAKEHRVVAVGFSMGGLVAVMLNRMMGFAGMVFINTPIYFWNLPQIAKNLLADFRRYSRYYFGESAGHVTLYTMLQFLGLLQAAKGQLSHVSCPALVVQADDDDSVWPHSARYICGRVRGRRTLVHTRGGSHQVLLDPKECGNIARQVARFLGTL